MKLMQFFFIEYPILLVSKCNYEKRGLFSGIPFKAKAALDIMGCTANHVSKTALEHKAKFGVLFLL